MVSLALMPLRSLLLWMPVSEVRAFRYQTNGGTCLVTHQLGVEIDVVPGHSPRGKEFLDVAAYCLRLDLQIASAFSQRLRRGTHMPTHAFLNHFPDRAAGHGQDWGSTSHGFDHYQAEGFVPLHGKQHCQRVSQKLVLLFQ